MRETLRTTKTIAPKTFALLGLLALTSLSSIAQAPGGVTTAKLKLWLKADAGTNTTTDGAAVTSWLDNSSTPNTITDGPNLTKPAYVANGANYNPSIFYAAGTYHVLSVPTISILGSTVFLAGTPVEASSGSSFHAPFASDFTNDYPLAFDNENFGYYNNVGTGTTFYPLAWAYDEPAFATARIYLADLVDPLTLGNVEVSKGGGVATTNFFTDVDTSTGKYMYIGGDPSGRSFGNVSEVIIYDDGTALTPPELQKVDSYLAMKYGVVNQDPDANNFLLSDGTKVWSTDFGHDILTIVRDDASALVQKQAHSVSDDTRLYVGALEATNIENTGTISNNKSAVVMADNSDPIKMTTELAVMMPVLSRFQRTWEIQATNFNFADNFSIEIHWDSAHYFDVTAFRLLVSGDGDFTSTIPATATFTNTGSSLIISGLSSADFPSGTQVYFTIGSTTLATLPAAMVFNAAVTPDSKVALNWQTTSEVNNNYFTVERSVDAQSWEAVTKVNGAGTTTSVKNYSFVDKNPYTGVSYYRLKQTDLDGKYSYSKVKTVKVDKNRNSILTIYPNPVSGTLYIKAGATELATLRIFNMTGIDVTTLVKTIETTTSGRVLDLSRLPNGNYNIKTTTAVTKVIKN